MVNVHLVHFVLFWCQTLTFASIKEMVLYRKQLCINGTRAVFINKKPIVHYYHVSPSNRYIDALSLTRTAKYLKAVACLVEIDIVEVVTMGKCKPIYPWCMSRVKTKIVEQK